MVKDWFDGYMERLRSSVRAGPEGGPYACPCCGYLTLDERGGWDICAVCFWEDDGQDDKDADDVRGGPNGALSLSAARRNFDEFGACDERSVYLVRPPKRSEIRLTGPPGRCRRWRGRSGGDAVSGCRAGRSHRRDAVTHQVGAGA